MKADAAEADGRTAPPGPGRAARWRRLDPRTYIVTALVLAGVVVTAGVPAGLGVTAALGVAHATLWTVAGAVLVTALGTGVDYVRWRRTGYRVGPERAELRQGLLLVKRRSLPLERIRTVDLTANPLLRVFGLVTVRIGTGEHARDGALELESVARAEGERLRRELLAHPPAPQAPPPDEGTLGSIRPAWVLYAPVSFLSPLLAGASAGGLLQISDWFGAQRDVIGLVARCFRHAPLGWAVAGSAGAALAAGAVGALGVWTEMWWNHRLEREPGGTLRVRRGLFTARSVSVEERRLRGVEVVEPLGVRLLRAARVDAVATGLVHKEARERHVDHRNLLPAAPRAVAHQVAARVLREPVPPTAAPLAAHPAAAGGRRLRRALAAALVPVGLAVVLGPWWAAVCVATVALPVAAALARSAYRALGHRLSGPYLVARSGAVRRSTVALQRSGVIGWTVRQSYVQRRAGLVTLTATTAAGRGRYRVPDAAESEALAFAEEAVPGLLAPFLTPWPPHGP
ncbi:PH domain-containing protein [Streptomyces tremellae]|uniref:YdbS-like PH domain-containing protein n=1 Tax=Streptomyces tremellae TaxID=1124239 RepID=A0ABP7FN27_9ACTN